MEQKENLIELSRRNPDTGILEICYASFPDRWMSLYNDSYRDYFRLDFNIILEERNDTINNELGDEYDDGWIIKNISLDEYVKATENTQVKLYSFD